MKPLSLGAWEMRTWKMHPDGKGGIDFVEVETPIDEDGFLTFYPFDWEEFFDVFIKNNGPPPKESDAELVFKIQYVKDES